MWRGRFYMALIDAEQSAEHPGLPMQVLSGDPKHLPFANHLHRLDPSNYRAGQLRSAVRAYSAIAV